MDAGDAGDDDPQERQAEAEADVARAIAEGSEQKAESWLIEKVVNEGGQTGYNVWHVEADGTRNHYGSAKTKRKAEELLKRMQSSEREPQFPPLKEREDGTLENQDAPPLPKAPKLEAKPKLGAKPKMETAYAFDWSKDDIYGGAKPPPMKKKSTTTKARKKGGHPWLSRSEQKMAKA